jgi:hypothetical protein
MISRSGIRDQGSGIRDQGSGIRDQDQDQDQGIAELGNRNAFLASLIPKP